MATIKRHNQTDDAGFKETDEQLKELEDRLSSLYTDASKEMEGKLGKFLEQYSERDKQKRELVEQGKMTEDEYSKWRTGQIFQTKKMQAQVDSLTETLVNTDKMAMQMVNGQLPSVYATNYNFQGFKAEQLAQAGGVDYASFTIYNADAVARLAKKDPNLLPAPKVDVPKDTRWNKTKINTAISQGIIQGEPINDIAARLRQVTDMDYNAAVRNARTATIGAQNAGRKDASERISKESGLEMVDVWSATYDQRTRDTHIMLDGQERGADGYFTTFTGEKLEYPCDPNGAPEEVYNCRCRLNTIIKGIDHSKDDELYEQFMEENYYDDWLKIKEQTEKKQEAFELNKQAVLEKTPVNEETKVITYGGHINDGISYKNRNYEFTEEGQEQIAKDLGVTKERAQEFEKAIDSYSAGGFRNIRAASCGQNDDPELKNKADAIEEFIDKSPKWDGGQLMRGIYVENTDDLQALIDAGKSGDAIDMLGMSSWTSNKEVAESYARVKSAGGEGKNVILVTNSTSTDFGTSIKHLSRFRAEDEVMVSSKADFVPTKVIKKKKAVYIYGDLMEAEDE